MAAGLGQHAANLDRRQQQNALFWVAPLTEPFAVLSPMFGRWSFSEYLLFILKGTGSKKRWCIMGVIAVQLIVNGITVIQIWAQCGKHVEALWDSDVAAHVSCQSPDVQVVIGFVQSSFNSLCDAALTVIPVLVLWNLEISRAVKVPLGLTLTASAFAFGASVVK